MNKGEKSIMVKILSERGYNKGISRQGVYEWEDDIKKLNFPIEYMDSYTKHPVARILRKLHISKSISWNDNDDTYIFFAMNIDLLRIITWYIPNVIPILLDVTLDEIDELYNLTKKLPVFWVTALKIKEALVQKYPNCSVCYMPQMASDRYLSEAIQKDISIIQFGRRNPVLHEYALEYVNTHSGTTYVYRCDEPQNGMEKYENGSKVSIGKIEHREEFISLLRKSKICLCSSPLMDSTRDFGEGIDFLTARWYEAIMNRCYIIARVSDIVQPELEQTQLKQLICNVSTYDEFERNVNAYLKSDVLSYDVAVEFAESNSAVYRGEDYGSVVYEGYKVMIYLFMNNGGMGNQMFQYAIARRLQIEYGMNIVCDLTKFDYKNSNATKRKYCLDEFNLTEHLEYNHTVVPKIYYKIAKKIISRKKIDSAEQYKRLNRKGIFAPEGYFEFYQDEKTNAKNLYVNGLFQAYQYFDAILPVLRKEFILRTPPPMEIETIINKIREEESVCIHWRRGDYLSEQYKDSLLVCNDEYYDQAIRKISERVEHPILYVFTNSEADAEWIKENHKFDIQVNYINLMIQEQHSDLDDFRIMCACKHFIISNSTFSWWAQYLSENDSKVVVAPSIWNRNEDAQGLYFDDWEVISV